MSPTYQEAALELFKAHHNAKEAAEILKLDYQKISAYFRGFNAAHVPKYDRFILIPDYIRADLGLL